MAHCKAGWCDWLGSRSLTSYSLWPAAEPLFRGPDPRAEGGPDPAWLQRASGFSAPPPRPLLPYSVTPVRGPHTPQMSGSVSPSHPAPCPQHSASCSRYKHECAL